MIFITHNVNHAYPVGDKFMLLNRGRSMGYFDKSEISREEVTAMMAGGQDLKALEHELAEFGRAARQSSSPTQGAVGMNVISPLGRCICDAGALMLRAAQRLSSLSSRRLSVCSPRELNGACVDRGVQRLNGSAATVLLPSRIAPARR